MVSVKGRFEAFVDYLGPQKGRKNTDAILYTVQDNITPQTVRLALINEDLLWTMSDDVTETLFKATFPKAVRIEQIL